MLWPQISKDIEENAREEYHDLIELIRDGGDMALAELEESTVFSPEDPIIPSQLRSEVFPP